MKRFLLLASILSLVASASSIGPIGASGGGGGGTWGSITGTLSNQTDLQSALNLKASLASPTFTGTVLGDTLNFSNLVHSGGAVTAVGGFSSTNATLVAGGQTASTVPYFDSSKALVSSAVTPTELGYVSGVTSAIQTQLNAKAPLASPTFTGTVALPNVTVSGSLKSGNYHIEPCFNDAGNSGTAQTIDFSTCSSQKSTLTGNVTYTFSNTVTGANYVIELSTGAGSYSTTWPGSVHWLNSGNAGPRVDTVGSNTCIVGFLYDGSTYWGNYVCTY